MKFLFQKGNTFAGKPSSTKNCEVCVKVFKVYNRSLKKGQGRFCSMECFGKSRRGIKPSLITRRKISEIAKQNGHGKWMIGKNLPKEWRENIGKASSLRTHSLKTRLKMSEARKGEKCWAWKGGITPINQAIRNSLPYRLWRESIFKRDNFTCVECNTKGGILNADHIKPFALFPKLRLDINNGRTLCVECHKQTKTFAMKRIHLEKLYASTIINL